MLNTFPFAFFALICLVIGDPELAPATALTKFRDLTFFNNLVHFVDETTPQNGHNPPQKITARVEEEKGDDFDGGYDGSESKNTYDEGPSEDVETKHPQP
ncbi:hypothetical protein JCM33374_g1740 [Metschnikowia sp. JCM 33374]|nr:hypothetical protein JCM33374_g1740 [Metschnikowia sp. JCM 33374]